jgi:diguanylate cyclase (GGDEF)-like protein/putative nucleotidyltransferase with HDIG domain
MTPRGELHGSLGSPDIATRCKRTVPNKVKVAIALMLVMAGVSLKWACAFPCHDWLRFLVYLAAILVSSGLKVAMPKGDGTMSVNFPFILLGMVQLAPEQAIALAALSVFAQCRIKVLKPFTFVQIAFNVANVIVSTAFACATFLFYTRGHMELAPALALAAGVYFSVNTVAVALVIGWSKGDSALGLWRREFPWYLPFYLVGAVLAAVAHLISLRFGWTTSLLLIPAIFTIYRAYQSQMRMVRDRQEHLEETEALHLRTIEGLAMAIEAKDHSTHEHLLRVRVYVSEIGAILGLPREQMQALLTASFLHDIGKLAVPEHIINKPGKLTPEEFEKMKIHPVVGADILERVRFPYPVVPIVRSHHEAWDGSGYPDGLKGEEIPIGARILTVVDCFDALASDRPYRKALPLDKAMDFVKSRSGIQFDPAIVKILEERHVELERRANERQEGLKPLDTEIDVWRGAAPAAGFQQENTSAVSTTLIEFSAEDRGKDEPRTSFESLNLIAAASQEAQAIFEMSQMLGNSLSANETISVMASRLRRLVPFDAFAIYLKNQDHLIPQYIEGEGARCFSAERLLIGEGLSGWVAQCGKTMLNGNPRVEQNYRPTEGVMPLNSALSLPLFDLQGEIFGVLTIYAVKPDAFSRDHLRILQAIESKFTLSLENALRFSTVEQDAQIDFVTQLPNIRHFFLGMEAELNRARRAHETLGVVVCDLNAFKAVNDRHGHQTGNELLQLVARGFRESCRSYDTVARIGGDEFVFLFPGVADHSCGSLLEVIEKTVRNACHELQLDKEVSASVGAAFYPFDGETSEELLGVADRRMYAHKHKHYESIGEPRNKRPVPMKAVA